MNSERFRIHAYINHHKLYNHKKQGCSSSSTYELYILNCDFLGMFCGIFSSKRNMFNENPTTTVDNYFVTDAVLDWADN